MDTTIRSILEPQRNPPHTLSTISNSSLIKWIQRLTLAGGLISLAVCFLVLPDRLWLLTAGFCLFAVSSFLELAFRWRDLKRAAARQDWQRYDHLQEVIQRIEDGFDVVSPVTPTIELDGQTVVVLRAWSAQTGKATLLLNQDGRAIMDSEAWRKSMMLIECANASLPGVSRNRRAIINTNLYARTLASTAWKRAITGNKDIFHHLGMATELNVLMEQWEALQSFLDLRIELFQAEDTIVEQVAVPAADQQEIAAWISAQERIHRAMDMLNPQAEKISWAAARLLTVLLDNKSTMDWDRIDELEAALKFAYLFQSLLKRTLNRWCDLMQPDLKTFQQGIELAHQAGLMAANSG